MTTPQDRVTKSTTPPNNNGGAVTSTPAPGNQGEVSSSRFTSNVVVYVVFGVKTVERDYNPSHVLPESDDKVSQPASQHPALTK